MTNYFEPVREIPSSEAKADLTQLLTAVERGESFTITRNGRAIAHLVPAADDSRSGVLEAMEQVRAFRANMAGISIDDILSTRHEGHRH